jgi:CubicO group peptidase (beta-lactamase class C family)
MSKKNQTISMAQKMEVQDDLDVQEPEPTYPSSLDPHLHVNPQSTSSDSMVQFPKFGFARRANCATVWSTPIWAEPPASFVPPWSLVPVSSGKTINRRSIRVRLLGYPPKSLVVSGLVLVIMLSAFAALVPFRADMHKVVGVYRDKGVIGILQVAVQVAESYYPWQRPSISWKTAPPESVGLDSSKLLHFQSQLIRKHTKAFLVVKNGQLVHEWHAHGKSINHLYWTAALSKAVTGSMVMLIALQDGRIALDEPIATYLPEWRTHPQKSKITFRHLAAHISGLDDVSFPHTGDEQAHLHGWKRAYYDHPEARFKLAIHTAPILFDPGTYYSYSGVGYHPLAVALAMALRSVGTDVRTALKKRIFEPLDIPENAWEISYGHSYDYNGLRVYTVGSGGAHQPRALARIGQFMLNKGTWNGKRLFAPELVDTLVQSPGSPLPSFQGTPQPTAAVGWWINANKFFPSLPEDAYFGAGAGHQVLLVIPSENIVMVRLGDPLTDTHWSGPFWQAMEAHLFAPFMHAIH